MLDGGKFALRCPQATVEGGPGVGLTRAEAARQLIDRWWRDEDENPARRETAEGLRPLRIDLHDRVADGGARNAVEIAVDFGRFDELAGDDHLPELLAAEEMVVNAVDLARSAI